MAKTLLLLTLIGFFYNPLLAQHTVSDCAASNEQITIDNGGIPLTIIGKGNARKSWTETVDGYLIEQNDKHIYEYVIKNKMGKIIPSGVKAINSTAGRKSSRAYLKANSSTIGNITKSKPFGIEAISTTSGTGVDGITPFTTTAMPTTGSIRVICLLVDYPDLANSYTKTDFENLLNQPDFGGTGSFKDYFTSSSFGNLDITVDVVDWVTAPNNFEYYGRVNGYGPAKELVRFAVDQAELNGIDFSIYDNDNDGDVDGIMVVHAGQGAEEGSQTQYIWSHRSSIASVIYDGKTIRDYIMNPETRATSAISTIGVFCHEFGHNLGLPDLYDTDGSSEGIGNWGLMGSASWLGGGKKPGGLSAWSKVKLGWQVPVEITANGTYTLNPAATNEEILLIYPGENKEYFLLENRQKLGVDNSLPGSGLAIWHIDDSKYSNSDETHKRVDLEEADGLNGLDNSSRGDAGDLYPGTSGNTVFNATSDPSNELYNGSPGVARLLNITQNADKTISFQADLDNIRFIPKDTIRYPATATGRSTIKTFGLKAFNYDFIITDITYPDGFSGTLLVSDTIKPGIFVEDTLTFSPAVAKIYKSSIEISGTANGVTITGSIPVHGESLQTLFTDNFETDKGWIMTGFERGAPAGLGGDPVQANEGTNVLGNVLGGSGEYENNLTNRQWVAVSPSFSTYGYNKIQMRFQQWLNLNSFEEDFAYLDISIDGGTTWKEVLRYGDWEINQDYWWQIMRDLSDYANWQEDVRLRFSLGETNTLGVHGGWNIDDLFITGNAEPYQIEANYNFGPTGIGINKTNLLTIKNGTLNDFSITAVVLPAGFSIDLPVGETIAAGSSKTFNLLFTPLAQTAYTGTFSLGFTDGTTTYAIAEPVFGEGVYLIFADDYETDKGWILSGGFEIGQPLGRGYDPITAFSGNNVLGTVLNGNGQYENNLTDRQWAAETPIINCTSFTNVKLNFARFNQIDGYVDSAYVDVSANGGTTWTQVWSTEGRWVGDWQWTGQSLDISTIADGQSAVMVRFSLGATDNSWTNAGWNIDDFSLSGNTQIAIHTTESLNFSDVLVGDSITKDIIITNLGSQALVISGIDYPTDFSGENFIGTIASGGAKTIAVTFTPGTPQTYTDTLSVLSNAATGNSTVLLAGNGIGGIIYISHTLDMGEVFLDSTVSTTVYLINNGNADLTISDISHSESAFSGSWSGVIAAGDSTGVTVSFTPQLAQLVTNTMTVISDAVAGSATSTITGTGIAITRNIILSTTTLDFGTVKVDSTENLTINVSNMGNQPLIITTITSDNSVYSIGWTTATIEPGTAKELNITFTPDDRNSYPATLTFVSNADSGDIAVALSGIGIAGVITVSANLEFGEVDVNQTKVDTVFITNSGDVPFDILSLNYANEGFSGDASSTIAVGEMLKIPITFSPLEAKAYESILRISSTAFSGLDSLALTGQGVDIIAGLENFDENLQVYPNPTSGEVHISLTGKNNHYSVLDRTGKEVLSGQLNGVLDMHTLADGIYTIRLSNDLHQASFRIMLKK